MWVFNPAIADCGIQGTASSPPSTAIFQIILILQDIYYRTKNISKDTPNRVASSKSGCLN